MSKKTLGIISSSVIAISLVMFFATSPIMGQPTQKNENYGLLPVDVPIEKTIAGNSVTSDKEASVKVGYEVKSPSYLPTGYRLQVINADDKLKIATMLASPNHITSQTTMTEFFMQQKGIFIFMEQNPPGFDTNNWLARWTAENSAQSVSINGLKGAVKDMGIATSVEGEPIQTQADLVFIKGTIIVEIHGFVPANQLTRIAETL